MSRFEDRLKLLSPAPASEALRAKIAHPAIRSRIWKRTVPIAAAAAGLIAALTFTILKTPTGTPARRDEAEQELRRIEKTLGAATLRVSYKRVADLVAPSAQRVEDDGILLLKEGSRLNLTNTETFGVGTPRAMTVTFVYLCDGKTGMTRVKSPQGMKTVQNIAVHPKDLNRKISLILARDCVALAPTILPLDLGQLERLLEATDVAFGTDEEGRRILTYRVKGFDVKLWVDPEKHLPLKRELRNKDAGTFTETYEGWELNPDLAEELFRLPE